MISIAATDLDWFNFLKNTSPPEDINFWTPTPWNIKRLSQGDKLYFMLKSPIRKIGGYGHFKYYENLSAKEAWIRFGKGNGVKNLHELISRCSKYVHKNSLRHSLNENPMIGCIVLKNCVFFDEEDYFIPEHYGVSFPLQVVKMKYIDEDFIIQKNDQLITTTNHVFCLIDEQNISYKTSKIKERKGQAQFRLNILKAYDFKCVISEETCLDIIEGAHIQQYINQNSNHIQNGIALRIDLHRLFDAGLITIDSKYRVLVSTLLNSETYTKLQGKPIRLPQDKNNYPSQEALEFHRLFVFRNF